MGSLGFTVAAGESREATLPCSHEGSKDPFYGWLPVFHRIRQVKIQPVVEGK
jgi:hypothetical protein